MGEEDALEDLPFGQAVREQAATPAERGR